MDFLHLTLAVAARCPWRAGVRRLLAPCFHARVAVDGPAEAAARRRLEARWPDGGRSCLRRERPVVTDAADVQVIVAAWNAEAYIRECVESILAQQSRYGVELTVVDDGSTDATADILQRYADQGRLRLLRQPNRGASAARNAALRELRGRYVLFVDADDLLPAGAVERLAGVAERTGADAVDGTFLFERGGRLEARCPLPAAVTPDWTALQGFASGKLLRRELFLPVEFPAGYLFEDTLYQYAVFPRCRLVATVAEPVYVYRDHSGSSSHRSLEGSFVLDALWVTLSLLSDAAQLGIRPDARLLRACCRDLRSTFLRLSTLRSAAVQRDAFVLASAAARRFFAGLPPEATAELPLMQALLRGDYPAFCLHRRLD